MDHTLGLRSKTINRLVPTAQDRQGYLEKDLVRWVKGGKEESWGKAWLPAWEEAGCSHRATDSLMDGRI